MELRQLNSAKSSARTPLRLSPYPIRPYRQFDYSLGNVGSVSSIATFWPLPFRFATSRPNLRSVVPRCGYWYRYMSRYGTSIGPSISETTAF